MKRKLLLAATSLMLAVAGGGGSASAYTVEELETAGWTKVTASSITETANNYYVLVDVNSSAYVMSNDASHYRPCYKTIADPVENPSFVWILEGSDNTFALKSYSTGSYFIQADGWNTSMTGATGSTTFNFSLSDGKYSINAVGRSDFVGHWNDDGAAVASDGENIAANKATSNAPGFLLYSISKATYDAALIAARETATADATEAAPADVTAWIQNADWSGDWGGWARSGSWGNQQWGQQTLESWNATNVIVKQELKGVPNGKYKVTADLISGPGATKATYVFGTGSAKVSSDVVSAEASANNYTTMSNEVAGNTLTADNIVVTGNTITIGFDQSTGWIVADNFKLYYYGEDLSMYVDAYNSAVDAANAINQESPMLGTALSALQTAISNYGTGVDESDKDALITATSALNTATADANTSIDAYAVATSAIADAKALQTAHNFVTTAAATTFAEAIAAIETPYNNYTLSNADATAAATTLGFSVSGWHGNANAAAVNYMESGFGLNDFDAALYINTWSTEGGNDGSNFTVPFFEYWTGDANSLGANTWTGTLTDLPNGLYKISAWVRVRAKNETAATDAAGISMNVNGGDAVDVTEGSQIGSSQFTIDEYTAQGLVKDGTLNVNFVVADGNNVSWLSFKNVKYTKVRDLTEEEAFVAATEEDYAALNAAIASKTIGFDSGEYAPYNNVEGVAALTAAKGIDQDANNSQENIQAATAAITGATWNANETEVNAIFDGSFEHDYSGQSGNINPIGWQRVKGAAADGYNVRYMNGSNAGLAATTSGKALFTKQSAYYGYADGYNMPLKANTYYKITFVYGGWGDCKKDGYVSMAAPDGSAVTLSTTDLPVDATNADSNTDSWKSYSATFKTGDAGDYVLGLRKKDYDTSGQSQYVYGDITIVRATGADFKDMLTAELATAYAIDVTANVGDAAFQIPASAASALTSAISDAQSVSDDEDATAEEIIQAVEDLEAAETTYNEVELNAPVEGKLYNIINISDGYNHSGKAVTFKSASDADLTGNTTSMGYNELPGSIYPQGVKFTAVDGVKNGYKLSYTRADGKTVYVGTGSSTGHGNNNNQIRPTTDASKAVTIKVIATSTDGVWNLNNTLANNTIGANGANDQGFYTTAQYNSMKLQEAVNNEVSLNIKAENQYGSIILPFNAEVPAGVTAYSVNATQTDGTTLKLVEQNEFEANTPYIVYAENGITETLAGLGSAYTDASYTEGWLTGVYTATAAPVGSYVLQNNDGKVGFYEVVAYNEETEKGGQPTVGANRAYLTAPAQDAKPRAFFFNADDATAIATIAAMTAGEVEGIYTIGGAKVQSLQKGINILKMKNGQTKKVIVK